MAHVGLDLGKRESQIAILTEDGELIHRRVRTERPRLVEIFGCRPPAGIRGHSGPMTGSLPWCTPAGWRARKASPRPEVPRRRFED